MSDMSAACNQAAAVEAALRGDPLCTVCNMPAYWVEFRGKELCSQHIARGLSMYIEIYHLPTGRFIRRQCGQDDKSYIQDCLRAHRAWLEQENATSAA